MINKVILIGRVGADPESLQFESGQVKTILSLATSEHYQHDGQWQEATTWHNLHAWGNLAQTIEQKVRKGQLLYIEGKLVTEKWTDKTTGDRKFMTSIRISTYRSLQKTTHQTAPPPEETPSATPQDDVPF